MDRGRRKNNSGLMAALTPSTLRHRAELSAAGLPALMAAAEKAVATLHSGDHRQRKTGGGENFWQFREYDPGDRPQDIDWRQSAKGDHLYVRQKEWQTAQSILFWAQNDKGMALQTGRARTSKHDGAIILSLALGILLTRAGEHIGPLEEPNHTGHSERALQNLAESLTRKPGPLPAGPLLPLVRALPKQSSLVLCGDFLCPPESLDLTLSLLSRQSPQGILIQILDPAEMDLSYNGRVIFRPMDGGSEFQIANVASVRKAYKERLTNHINTVQMIARRHGYGHILHITSDDPRTTLSGAWHLMAPQPRMQARG